MDASYYIENNPFKKPPRSNSHLQWSIAGLLFLGLFLFWSNRGARDLRDYATERQEASLPRLRPLRAAPIEPLFQKADDPGTPAADATLAVREQAPSGSAAPDVTSNISRAAPARETLNQTVQTSGLSAA